MPPTMYAPAIVAAIATQAWFGFSSRPSSNRIMKSTQAFVFADRVNDRLNLLVGKAVPLKHDDVFRTFSVVTSIFASPALLSIVLRIGPRRGILPTPSRSTRRRSREPRDHDAGDRIRRPSQSRRQRERYRQAVRHPDHDVSDELAGGKCSSTWGQSGATDACQPQKESTRASPRAIGPFVAATDAGVTLEPVVEIIMSTAHPGPRLAREIRRDKERSEPLHLADMGQLVARHESRHARSRPMTTWPSVIAAALTRQSNQRAKPP